MNDFDTVRAILAHAADLQPRIGAISVASAPTIRLRDDDVSSFRAWVGSLSSASPVYSDAGENRAVLSCTGLIKGGRRVSVVVDVRADLLRRNDLVGFLSAHELARLAPMVVNR
ncbi:hypothetical protein [Amycolatopsis sp. NPDC049159]|uniref:hypothetical protein n=1 Tax=Amycolatopsis sp. NPDC049159 TaxID=3157210 RepID=UPI0033F5E58F